MRKIAGFVILGLILISVSSKPKPETASSPQYMKDYNAAVRAQDEKDYETAIERYQKAVNKKSDFADAWNNMGYCYRMIAKSYLEKSGKAYAKAINYSPKHQLALEYQGEYFIMMGQLKSAYTNYQKLEKMQSHEADDLRDKLDDVLKQAQYVLKRYSP